MFRVTQSDSVRRHRNSLVFDHIYSARTRLISQTQRCRFGIDQIFKFALAPASRTCRFAGYTILLTSFV
jgi:hypothetical protein